MKRALVVGLGVSGQAAMALLRSKGYDVVGVDDHLWAASVESTDDFDEVVVSPGIPRSHPLYCKRAIGEAELALRYLTNRLIGITGTNGKTTVTLMVTHILNTCGIKAKAVGNIGTPLSELVGQKGVGVVELSSYQLETMSTCAFESGILLNISEDHLDRYKNMDEYAAAKLRLQLCVKGPFWISEQVKKRYSVGGALIYDRDVETIQRAEYKGIDRLNVLASGALCQGFGIDAGQVVRALKTFTRPPHRMEQVSKVGKVTYVNDSKGTNPDATIAALKELQGPIWLIAGGQDKGASFAPWKEAFEGRVKRLLLIGEGAERIKSAVAGSVPIEECGTLEKALERCKEMKQGTVLLSPGCASFDQFANYEARGDTFRKLVGRE